MQEGQHGSAENVASTFKPLCEGMCTGTVAAQQFLMEHFLKNASPNKYLLFERDHKKQRQRKRELPQRELVKWGHTGGHHQGPRLSEATTADGMVLITDSPPTSDRLG